MGTALELFSGGSEWGGRRNEVARRKHAEQQLDVELFRLMGDGKKEEFKALVRKRLAETGLEDVTDVANLARQLAGEDAYIASLLIPIVQDFARTVSHSVRDFGRGSF